MANSAEREAAAIIAALLWDVPDLRASGVPGADAFIAELGADRVESVPEGEAPLELAARFLRADATGDADTGSAALEGLVDLGPWPNLLAMHLVCFSRLPAAVSTIEQGLEMVAQAPQPLRPYLYMKLATAAYDRGLSDSFLTALERAEEESSDETRLGILVRAERAHMLGGFFGLGRPLPPAPFVELPWVTRVALDGAQEHLDKAVQERARRPWTWNFSVGRTPIDRVVAAERQLTWTGMLWDRRAVRRQLGSQILSTAPTDSALAGYALLMWLLGGGSWNEISSVTASVESVLDSPSVDELLRHLFNVPGPGSWRELVIARVGLALWDAMSDEMARALLGQLRPAPGDDPTAGYERRLMAALALRAPGDFATAFSELRDEQKLAVVDELVAETVDRLPDDTRAEVQTLARAHVSAAGEASDSWTLVATFAPEVLTEAASLQAVPTDVLVDAMYDRVLPSEDAARAELERRALDLARGVRDAADAARGGRVGFGSGSTAQQLGAVIAVLPPSSSRSARITGIRALTDTASDERLPGQLRLEALAGLALADSAHPLPPWAVRRLRASSTASHVSFLMGITASVLDVARLKALARRLTLNERAQLLSYVRDPDARVRQMAVQAAAAALSSGGARSLEHILVIALFDPEEDVLAAGLTALSSHRPRDAGLLETVVHRLEILVERSPRAVRLRAGVLAAHLREEPIAVRRGPGGSLDRAGVLHTRLDDVLARVQHDKSWLVRHRLADAPNLRS